MLDFRLDRDKCISCGGCAADCPAMIIDLHDGYPRIRPENEKRCYRCQHCLAICPTGAISILGHDPRQSRGLAGNFPPPEQLATLVRGRRSVRRYLDENLDPALIDELLRDAWHAPSAHNQRMVHFHVVDDREAMARLRELAYAGIRENIARANLPARLGFFKDFVPAWEKHGTDVIFRGAPHLLIASAPKRETSPEIDCVIALASFELLAQCRGIGTLWNGLAKWTIEKIVPELRDKLGIPANHVIGYCMSFGQPSITYRRTVQYDDVPIARISTLES